MTRRTLNWSLTAIVLAVVLAEVIMASGMIWLGWRGPRTTAWSRFIPVPIASVQWHMISGHAWLEQYQGVTHYNDQLTATSPQAFPAKSAGDNAALAMTKIVRDVALTQLLRQYHLKVSAADVDQAYEAQLTQTGNRDKIAETIKQLYGWTPQQFKDHVIWTVVARDHLQQQLSFDPVLSKTTAQQADHVLALVKAGDQSFSDIAKSYSDDAYGASGGDLGFVAHGSQIKEIDDAAFSLPLNQVSGVIHSKYGFHIIKVTERKTVDGQDEAHVFQIFVSAPSVDSFLTKYLSDKNVWLWQSDIRWNTTNGQAVASS